MGSDNPLEIIAIEAKRSAKKQLEWEKKVIQMNAKQASKTPSTFRKIMSKKATMQDGILKNNKLTFGTGKIGEDQNSDNSSIDREFVDIKI